MARKSGTEQRGVRGKGEEAKRGRDEIERREGRDREKGGREGRKRPERGGGGGWRLGESERHRREGSDENGKGGNGVMERGIFSLGRIHLGEPVSIKVTCSVATNIEETSDRRRGRQV